MSTHNMTTRSKSQATDNTKTKTQQNNSDSTYTCSFGVIPNPETNKKMSTEIIMVDNLSIKPKGTKPQVDIVTLEELTALGLTPKSFTNGKWKKVISTSDLDVLLWKDEHRGKFAVAPEGWYWKDYSVKNYYWFDWCELEPIPI